MKPAPVLDCATLGDLDEITAIEAMCFDVDPWPRHYFASELVAAGRFHRVARSTQGRLAGYCFCAWLADELHLLRIATRPACRRLGIARTLLESCFVELEQRNGHCLTLEVRASNSRAQAAYSASGLRVVGRRKGYYAGGEDAVIMSYDPSMKEGME